MFQKIPVGVGRKGEIKCTEDDLDRLLAEGVDWAVEKGIAWPEDRDHCEENGRMDMADPSSVSKRAKKRGMKQGHWEPVIITLRFKLLTKSMIKMRQIRWVLAK